MASKKTSTLGKNLYHRRSRPPITRLVQGLPPPPAAGALREFLKRRIAGDVPHPYVKEVRGWFEASYLSKWVRGKGRPTFDQAYLLEELSHGAVRLADWVVPEAVEVLRKEPNPKSKVMWERLRDRG
jgi:hypothetical protein